jgi:hypothetical protein
MLDDRRLLRAGFALLGAAIVVALAAYAWRGWYSRYVTDDYCTASALRRYGFVDVLQYHRVTWSGRYSYYAVKAIPESIGPITTRYTPAVLIVLFCAAGVWAMRRVWPRGYGLPALVAGCALAFATIDATPDILAIGGPLVWETGSVTYMVPLILMALWAGLYFSGGALWLRCAAAAVLLFVAGGMSETSLAGQGAITVIVLLIALWRRQRDASWISAVSLAVTLLSLYLVASAPGNTIRQLRLPPRPPLFDAVLHAFRIAYHYVGSVAFSDGKSLLIVLLCGALLGAVSARVHVPTALLCAFAALAAYVASLLPSTWMLSMGPPPRALHVTNFFFVAMLLALAVAFGASKPRFVQKSAPIAVFVALLIPVFSTMATLRTLDEGRRAAAEVERIGAIMTANKGKRVTIHSPWAIANRILVEEPEFWTNRCISEYYQVIALRVTR